MKFPRFLIFIFNDFYPQGGFNDLAWWGDDLVEFLDSEPYKELITQTYCQNIQIIDTFKLYQVSPRFVYLKEQIIFSIEGGHDTIPNWVEGKNVDAYFASKIEEFINHFNKFNNEH